MQLIIIETLFDSSIEILLGILGTQYLDGS
jgi:hypothetical protein